jgi:hypothetical protein
MSSTQVPDSSSSSLRLPRREIDWNDTPWQEDIFGDNEDMQRSDSVTINVVLTVNLASGVIYDDMFLNSNYRAVVF